MSALWLWHHGATTAPANTCVGWTDVPLADPGAARVDAQHLLARVGEATAIWSSDLARARQTARPLARALGLKLQVSSALREINYGAWEGETWPAIRGGWPEEHARYMASWADVTMPLGESYATMRARVVEWWGREEVDGHMVVVAHAGPLRALAGHLLGWSQADEIAVTLARGHCAVIDRSGQRGPGWNFPPKPGGAG